MRDCEWIDSTAIYGPRSQDGPVEGASVYTDFPQGIDSR